MNWIPRCRIAPWQHQIVGTNLLLERPGFVLMDDVGFGKSKQCVDALCHEVTEQRIDALIVVTPGFARSVWASPDPLLGEFAKHVWEGVPTRVTEYCARRDALPPPGAYALDVIVTNYEFLRRVQDTVDPVTGRAKREKSWPRLEPLIAWAKKRRAWLLLDESWSIQNPQADQAKACYLLRQACQRVTLLNGTPGTPDKLFTQFQILDSKILECRNYFQFRGRYCTMGGWQQKKVIGFKNMEDFERRTRDYGIRRDSGLDIPPVLPPVTIEARLSDREWAVYRQMRDELVAWLDRGEAAVAQMAGTRTLRLSQILAGFVGGVEDVEGDLLTEGPPASTIRDVGHAKLDAVAEFLAALNVHKAVVWCRFRPEMDRMASALEQRLGRAVHRLQGQQPPDERDAAKRAFAPGTASDAPALLVGHPAAGGAGLNFAAANVAVYATNPWSWKDRKQSEGRINRPGQTRPVRFVDVVAVGPDGQRTLDHTILRALRDNDDIANWTAETWRRALTDEQKGA